MKRYSFEKGRRAGKTAERPSFISQYVSQYKRFYFTPLLQGLLVLLAALFRQALPGAAG